MDENQKPPEAPRQPIGALNGPPPRPMASMPGNLHKKSSKWRYFFIVLGILQALGVAIFLLVMLWAVQQAKAGVSGTEFIGLFLFITLVPAVGIIALINLIGLPIYMIKHKSRGKGLVFGILSLVISALLALCGAYSVYQLRVAVPNRVGELNKEFKQRNEEEDRQFVAANAKPEIAKEEAIELLKACKLKGFYYTKQTESENLNGMQFPSAEASAAGVVLVKVDGEPYRISIADRLVSELVPIAREVQKTCDGPQFWHDGTYEQYKDGKWYFKDEVVNAVQSGKTKDEAMSFMQNCKADYFIGYTDISLVKDANTKSWLDNAEKSTTGIEILEDPLNSYVFTSKAMTIELQDVARQFRQSCYSTKKLYITIDDWLETEYPAGVWARVKR